MNTKFLHKDFLWNGNSFESANDLIDFVNSANPELSDFMRQWFGKEGLIHIKTSGSTGSPKIIALRREHMIHSAEATARYFNLSNKSRALLCLPLNYIAGRMMLVRAMVLGWDLDVIEPSSQPDIPLNKRYDFSAMVPLQLHRSLANISAIGALIVGGGMVSDLLKGKLQGMRTKIYETYGMTETITHVAVRPLNKAAGQSATDSCFLALPDVCFSIDQRNCLIIDASKVCEELIVTNDVVDLHSKTSFRWLARYDHVINSGGLKLFPELIEKKIASLIDRPFFITGIQDEALGEKLVLMVEGKEQEGLMDVIKGFQNKYPDKISSKEIPRDIYFVPNFQRTASNKLNRIETFKSFFKEI